MQAVNEHSEIPDSGAVQFRGLLAEEFDALDLVIDDTQRALKKLRPGSESEVMRLALGQRSLLLLHGARLLLEEGHWEIAAGVVRQMFEVLVNVEHLLNQSDTEAAWKSYRTYGEAQLLQASLRKMKYAIATGYIDEAARVEALEATLKDAQFDEFRHPKGHIRDSWSGLSVGKLAEASRVTWRTGQYRYYYRSWSEQAHGSSSSLINSVAPRTPRSPRSEEYAAFAREARQEIAMIVELAADLTSALGIFGSKYGTTVRGWRELLSRKASE
ncbi:DUF5677 domain-containing protein [Demequina aurantiaca]|uniref:DUF5677 domain-containing protein n=1 Tax=Demequina aurantiaca TaxID=676200 RepID=UPI003D358271